MNFIALKNLHLQRIWWAITSPSLLAHPQQTQYFHSPAHLAALAEILRQEDQNPALVNAHFENLGHLPMGRYFEQLLFFILQRDPHYEVLAENRQLFEGKITIGELDLILRNNHSGKLEHWEIALKFYLQVKNNPAPQHMLGPSTQDNLEKKLLKLIGAQLPLSQKDEIRQEFPQLEAKLFVKGIFFYPWQKPFCISAGVSPTHLSGEWLKLSALSKLQTTGDYWRIKNKPAWIGGEIYTKPEAFLSFKELMRDCTKLMQETERPQLIALYTKSEALYTEEKYFVIVGDGWPKSNKV